MPVAITSFDSGLQALVHTDDVSNLHDIIKETLSRCPGDRTKVAKAQIAAILQRKYTLETQKAAASNPALIQEVDKKYHDLSVTLKSIPVMGMEGTIPQTQPKVIAPSPKLPVKTPIGNLGSTLLQSWFAKKKALLGGTVFAGGTICGLIYLYNRIWGGAAPDFKKKPLDKSLLRQKELNDFEKMVKSLDNIRTFTRMSKNPDFFDYSSVLKNPSKLKKPDREAPLSKKLSKWNQEEQALMKEMDQAAKAITTLPKRKSLPSFTNGIDFSLPKVKIDSSPIFKTDTPKRPRKPRTPVDLPKETSPEPEGKIIPVSKRAKRVRKVSQGEE